MSNNKSTLRTALPLVIAGVAAGAAAIATYARVVRPWHLRWGATDAEVKRILPGDDLVLHPKLSATHAITIRAPAAHVWKWLVQMGQGRGGMYTYDWLENMMLHLDMHSANEILPEFQNLKVGDVVPFAPGGIGPAVLGLEPNKYLLLGGKIDPQSEGVFSMRDTTPGNFMAVSWLLYLEPIDEVSTRLLERIRFDWAPTPQNNFYMRGFLEPGSFLFERGMLRGIKARAEKEAHIPAPVFKSEAGKAEFLAAYNETLKLWKVPLEEFEVPTRFGMTHVVACGAQDAPPLFLLHAVSTTATEWFANVRDLSRAHRVYALDIIGDAGKSVATRSAETGSDFADWYRDVLDALKLDSADVVGHSYGGWITLNIALYAGERVNKIVLLAPAEGIFPFKRRIEMALRLSSIPMPITPSTRGILQGLLAEGNQLNETFVRQMEVMTKECHAHLAFPTIFTDEELQQIETPALLLLGTQEVIYDPKRAMARASRLMPNLHGIMIPQSSHMLNMEEPNVVNSRILEFIGEGRAVQIESRELLKQAA